MKNFIYLPLVALIFLCSCKSNSFMTQRYTKFGHESHKNSQEKVTSISKYKDSQKNETDFGYTFVKSSEAAPISASVATEKTLVKPFNLGSFHRKVVSPLFKTHSTEVSQSKSDVSTSNLQKVEAKKTFKEKIKAGLFSTVYSIVVFCVVVVVVVAVVVVCLLVLG